MDELSKLSRGLGSAGGADVGATMGDSPARSSESAASTGWSASCATAASTARSTRGSRPGRTSRSIRSGSATRSDPRPSSGCRPRRHRRRGAAAAAGGVPAADHQHADAERRRRRPAVSNGAAAVADLGDLGGLLGGLLGGDDGTGGASGTGRPRRPARRARRPPGRGRGSLTRPDGCPCRSADRRRRSSAARRADAPGMDSTTSPPSAWSGSSRRSRWSGCPRSGRTARPHLVPTWFVWDGEAIVIRSKPGRQKVRNLRPRPARDARARRCRGRLRRRPARGDGRGRRRRAERAGACPPAFLAKYRGAHRGARADPRRVRADLLRDHPPRPRRGRSAGTAGRPRGRGSTPCATAARPVGRSLATRSGRAPGSASIGGWTSRPAWCAGASVRAPGADGSGWLSVGRPWLCRRRRVNPPNGARKTGAARLSRRRGRRDDAAAQRERRRPRATSEPGIGWAK